MKAPAIPFLTVVAQVCVACSVPTDPSNQELERKLDSKLVTLQSLLDALQARTDGLEKSVSLLQPACDCVSERNCKTQRSSLRNGNEYPN